MKKILKFVSAIVLTALVPVVSNATVFFNDNFSNGSTLNSATPTYPGTNYTSYEMMSAKTWVPTPSIAANNLKFGIASSSSGAVELQALFATNPVALVVTGDYVQMTIVFTNFSGVLTTNMAVGVGLYNSGQVLPVAGGLNATCVNTSTDHSSGNAQNWAGYVAQLSYTNTTSRIMTRTNQAGGIDNRCQDLVTSGSGSQSYGNPGAATIDGTYQIFTSRLTNGGIYTEVLTITLNSPGSMVITNQLFSGPDTNGTLLSQFGGMATNASFYTTAFDSMAIGWRTGATNLGGTTLAISSINVSGQSSPVPPPTITAEPVPVQVTTNGSCAFMVTATGAGSLTYQWHRNGTNLVNGGNISGANGNTLIISPAGTADILSGVNGYYVTVANSGGSTNSITNSLALIASTNLLWTGFGTTWDLNSSQSWFDPANNQVNFNYGDPVTFDDTGINNGQTVVTLSGSYLSAASVTFNHSFFNYTLQGSGSFAGPGSLNYIGAGQVTINNANSYTGGTIISNASAVLTLNSYAGVGSGPVTFALAGATLELVNSGSASSGIPGGLVVNDNATVKVDATGSFAAVFFGDLSGVSGKTLNFTPASLTTTNRIRLYGSATTNNANIVLNGPVTSQANYNGTVIAPYNGSGIQAYNGVISGNGGIVQRAGGTTILNAQNTYSGGTWVTTGTIGLGADSTGTVTSGPLGTGPLYLAPEIPNATGSGTVLAYGGAHSIANPLLYPSGTNNQTLIVAGTNDLTFTGPVWLNGLDGNNIVSTRTFTVNNTGLTTIQGAIADTNSAGWGLTKNGTNRLALSATETYTGPTIISAGTLAVNGALNASSAVTATTGGLLGGTGTVNGSVTVTNGGGIAPGNSIGTLTVNNAVTMYGGTTSYFEVNKTNSTKDVLVVNGNITYNGTLVVSNLAPASALAVGDTFQLFQVSGTKTGTFTNIIGGPLATGMGFVFTNTTGTLAVVQTVNPNPTNITFSVTNSAGAQVLSLSWPVDHTGWRLQVQTNTLAVGIQTPTNTWYDVPNSTTINATNYVINPNTPTLFFKMVYP